VRHWRRSSGPALRYVASKAFRLVDDFTASPPHHPVAFILEEPRSSGRLWAAAEVTPARSAGGILAFAGLGLATDPAAQPVRRYRLRFLDDPPRAIYRPAFRATLETLEFDVPTYSHTVPPANEAGSPELIALLPGASYPFPRHLPVLHGTVHDATGPVADVQVSATNDHVLSDERGAFALPLRLTSPAASVLVLAEHLPTSRSTSATVPLPNGLGHVLELKFA